MALARLVTVGHGEEYGDATHRVDDHDQGDETLDKEKGVHRHPDPSSTERHPKRTALGAIMIRTF
jgi:hypothetical protein